MNNYCRNCGNKIEEELKKCNKCGAEILEKRVDLKLKQSELKEYRKKEKKYINVLIGLFSLNVLIGIIIVLYSSFDLYVPILSSILSIISPILWLMFLVALIYIRVAMPGSKTIRLIFKIVVGLILSYLAIVVMFFLLVFIAFSSL